MKKVLLLKQEGNTRLKWKRKHLFRRELKGALAFVSIVCFLLISTSSFAYSQA